MKNKKTCEAEAVAENVSQLINAYFPSKNFLKRT